MGYFEPLIGMLADPELNNLRAANMGDLHLGEVVDTLRLVRSDLEAADDLTYEQIPSPVRNNMLGGNFRNRLASLVSEMQQYGPSVDSPRAERDRLAAEAEELKDQVLVQVVPITRTDAAKVQEAMAAAESLRSEAQAVSARLNSALAEVEGMRVDLAAQQAALATASAGEAATDLATHYKTQAEAHAGTATTFFAAGVVAAVVLTVLTVVFLVVSPPDYGDVGPSEKWLEVVRGTVARLAILSIAAFALAFCVRNYRVNMHLEVLNKRRQNALNTFGLLQAAVTSEDARNIVVGELVRAVFTSEETGYLGGESERTIIESPGGAGILSAMSATSRPQGN